MKNKINLAVVMMLTLSFFSMSVVGGSSTTINKKLAGIEFERIYYGAFEYYTTGDNCACWLSGDVWHAQSFTVGTTGPNVNFTALYIRLKVCKTILQPGYTVGPLIVSIRESLTGRELTIGCINGDSLPETYSWCAIPIKPVKLYKDSQYDIVARAPAVQEPFALIQLVKDSTGEYSGGQNWHSSDSGQTWWDGYNPDGDFLFQVIGIGPC